LPLILRRRVIWMAWAAGDLDGLGGVGEGQTPGYRGDLEGAPLGAAVAAFALGAGHRHVAPGQGGDLGMQAGLVQKTPLDTAPLLQG
jgi:hypothetical protein